MSSPLKTLTGRADLMRALTALADAAPDPVALQIAESLGFEWTPPQPDDPEPETPSEVPPPLPQAVEAETETRPPAPASFWRADRLEWLDETPDTPEPPAPAGRTRPVRWRQAPVAPPAFQPLAPWAELAPRLRRALSHAAEGRSVDVPETIRYMAEGRILEHFPRTRLTRWGTSLYLVEDLSRRLIPFRTDQGLVRRALQQLLPAHQLVRCVIDESFARPVTLNPAAVWPPHPGARVLVLGDLAALARIGDRQRQHWLALGQQLRAEGCHPLALFPGPTGRCPGALAAVWDLIPWERPRPHDGRSEDERAEHLLQLAATATRLEPGLLRDFRLLLPPEQADAATEADVWQHPALVGDAATAGTLHPEKAQKCLNAFAGQPPALHRRVAHALRAWRYGLPTEIWFIELLNLPRSDTNDPLLSSDLQDARDYLREVCHAYQDPLALDHMPGADRRWLQRISARSVESLWLDPEVGRPLARLTVAAVPEAPIPPGLNLTDTPYGGQAERQVTLLQSADQFTLAADDEEAPGSPLAILHSRNGLVQIEPAGQDETDAFWETGTPPGWADAWGRDDYGAWASFSVTDTEGNPVIQRMRWIPPGRFLMGSPEEEPARDNDEGPQHPVTYREGFWLFDTACTQALWTAVMGDNPSHFSGMNRPVENVNWHDTQRFIEHLNGLKPGLGLSLPSEAQWEYACRAGTTTPFSFGETITPEQVNYNGNHPYAGSPKGGYRKETVPVGSLPPNPWGLYEMHGNVWEWMQDTWHSNYQDAPTDGSAWESGKSSDRVMRGGAWYRSERYCRAAYRARMAPVNRFNYQGFRCLRVQAGESGERSDGGAAPAALMARPAERRRPGRQGDRAQGGPTSTAPLLRLDRAGTDTIPLPLAEPASADGRAAASLLILTDRQRLTLRRERKPGWAQAMGRDRYGLWAEFSVDPQHQDGPPVIQRMRWIPPGRFLMGSPEEEPQRDSNEGPQHPVTFREGFWLFDTACTQALWTAVVGFNPSRFEGPDLPVESVSWHDAQYFIQCLNGLVSRLGLSLPSESQWEYSCRAGTNTVFNFGDTYTSERINSGYGSGLGVPLGRYRKSTIPVKNLPPNSWGLYAMHGNVWEWVQDTGHRHYQGAPTDGRVWGSDRDSSLGVLRGGSWLGWLRDCRSASRLTYSKNYYKFDLGFRCALIPHLKDGEWSDTGEAHEDDTNQSSRFGPSL